MQAFIGTDHGPGTPILTCQEEDEDHGFTRGNGGSRVIQVPGFPSKVDRHIITQDHCVKLRQHFYVAIL